MTDSFYGVVSLAGALAEATGRAFIVLDAQNGGGDHNLSRALPSLDQTQVEELGAGTLILGYPNDDEAQKAFNALTAEARRGYGHTGSMVETTVTYVGRVGDGPVMSTANESGFGSERGVTWSFFGGKLIRNQPTFVKADQPSGIGLTPADMAGDPNYFTA